MRALTWQGRRDVRVENVPDPTIQEPTDAVVRITSSAICGSDLHLYEVLGPYLTPGDILGHEPMGIVEEVGSEVTHIAPGDRVVVPFNISCGSCWMCSRGLFAQCETTQVRKEGKGAALFGYTSLYGAVPGGQAEYLRVPQAHFGPIKVPEGTPDEQFLFLSDVVPTAWQAVRYADGARGRHARGAGSGADRADGDPDRPAPRRGPGHRCRLGRRTAADGGAARRRAARPARGRRRRRGVDRADRRPRSGRRHRRRRHGGARVGPGTAGKVAQAAVGLLPDAVAQPLTDKLAVDRLDALYAALKGVRRGGTVSLSGVYGGEVDPMPMMEMFDRGIQLRMGQAHVKRWIDEIMPLVSDPADPLGVLDLTTHQVPLDEAPQMYEVFQKKEDDCIKVVLKP